MGQYPKHYYFIFWLIWAVSRFHYGSSSFHVSLLKERKNDPYFSAKSLCSFLCSFNYNCCRYSCSCWQRMFYLLTVLIFWKLGSEIKFGYKKANNRILYLSSTAMLLCLAYFNFYTVLTDACSILTDPNPYEQGQTVHRSEVIDEQGN